MKMAVTAVRKGCTFRWGRLRATFRCTDCNPRMAKSDGATPAPFAPKRITPSGAAVLAGFVILESAVVLMVSASKTADGHPPYNTASVVMVVEIMKLLASIFGLWSAGQVKPEQKVLHVDATGEEEGLGELRRITIVSFLRYGVPSFLYAVNNNIFLYILTRMPPAYFQLLLNCRVVLTGLAFRWFMGRELTQRQWLASVTLLFGCALSQWGTIDDNGSQGSVTLTGLLLTCLYCFVSVTASVYNELLMKKEPSLHLANIQLYAFGALFNLAGFIFQSGGWNFWAGWESSTTWTIVSFQIVIGLLISRVMKNFDSIMKIFCVACSNLVVYGASVLFGTQPFTLQFVSAFIIVTWSGYRYSVPADA